MKQAFRTPGGCRFALLAGLRAAAQAFTMAEILLSLTIIGVVAAITLPSLTGNINERTWNTQRKALYARISQAIALMPALNGYGTFKEESSSGADDAVDNVAETFITSGLSKVLKINNICDGEHLEDCGLTSKINIYIGVYNADETYISFPDTMQTLLSDLFDESKIYDTKAAAFETVNGESIALYYNPKCTSDMNETVYYALDKICANMIYDLNGTKGPNTVGKDIGVITILHPTDSNVVAPNLYVRGEALHFVSFHEAISSCKAFGNEYRLPNRDELVSLKANYRLFGIASGQQLWSATRAPNDKVWGIGADLNLMQLSQTAGKDAYCVER